MAEHPPTSPHSEASAESQPDERPTDRPGEPNDAAEATSEDDIDLADLKVSKNRLVRALWFGLGLLMTALGFIGAFLPVMPTTVFMLLAAFFFARSSPRFYRWLLTHPQFGQLIRDWRAGRGLTLRAKITAVSLIIVTTGSSALFFVPSLLGKLALALVGVGVSAYLVTRPTKPA